jgi:hypothetical protein
LGNLTGKPRSDESEDAVNNPLSLLHKAQPDIAGGVVETTTPSTGNRRQTQSQTGTSSLSAASNGQKSLSSSEKPKRKGVASAEDLVVDGKTGDQTPTKKLRTSAAGLNRGRARRGRGGGKASGRGSGTPADGEGEDGDTED